MKAVDRTWGMLLLRGKAERRLMERHTIRKALTVFRIAASIGLIVLLFSLVDVRTLRSTISEINVGIFALALLLVLMDRLGQAWRWLILLRAGAADVSAWVVVQVHLIATFLGNFLPFNLGSDGSRVFGMASYSGKGIVSLSSVIVDKVINIFSVAVISALAVTVAMVWNVASISTAMVWSILGGLVSLLVLAAALSKVRGLWSLVPTMRWKVARWTLDKARLLHEACLSYKDHGGAVASVFAISVASLLISGVLFTYLVARMLGIDVPLPYYFMVVPIINFLKLLPISANGIGIQEGAFVLFFTQAGASATEALMLGLAVRVLWTMGTLPGGLILALRGYPTAADR